MSEVEHLLACQNELGEGPLWCVDEQLLYWIDIKKHSFSRYDPATGQYVTFNVGTPIGVMAERAHGGLIMATKRGFATWNAEAQQLEVIVDPEAHKPYMRFNDGAVDCAGRFWAGTMGDGPGAKPDEGVLYRLDPDGSVHTMIQGCSIPNGIGWNTDNTLMYFTDTGKNVIYAFDFDARTGNIANQRVVVEGSDDGAPDGLTMDSENYFWSAYWDGAKVVRHAPDGTIDRVIKVPALRPTSCVFGGADLTELYITSAAVDNADQKSQYPFSGDLFRVKTNIRGQAKYKFGA